MTRRLIAPAALALVSAMLFIAPAHADGPACTTTINPGDQIQSKITNAGAGAVVCFTGGTFTPTNAIVLPGPMTVKGIGSATVIECATLTYCIDGTRTKSDPTTGPSNVDLENLVLKDATKADLQVGTGNSPIVTGWTISGVTATGAGEVGVAINNAQDVTVSNSTFSANGSTPYDAMLNPTGDFGFRSVRVDSLTVQNSTFTDNVTTTGANPGFAGGAKFNTDTNFTVTGNTFTGNAGGGQLWIDIDSQGFDVTNNTIDQTSNATQDGIRVEVSCGGTIGGTAPSDNNVVQGGTQVGIDLFDSNDVQVQQNQVSTTQPGSYGIRMYGNGHSSVPGHGCDDPTDVYPNANNTATGNTITLTASANGLDGVWNDPGGTSTGNAWSANAYFVRHCSGAGSANWVWWDGSAEQTVDFAGWQAFGQDLGPAGTCTSTYPRIDSFSPIAGQIGAVVTINGSGLAGTTAVRFHQVPVLPGQFLVVSDSQIVATVPPMATTGPICVTAPNPGGCTTTSFIVQPAATVTGIEPSSGTPGTVVAIQGTALTGASGVTFAGAPAASFNLVSDSEIDAPAPPGVTSGPVCVLIQVQGSVCTPFTVVPPAAPTITSPVGMFQLLPYSMSWGAVAGADSYLAQWQSAPYNHGYKAWAVQPPTTGTSLPAPFVMGQTTCFQVASQDSAGPSPNGQTCTAVPLDDGSLKVASGSWTKLTGAQFFGGSAMGSVTKKASLTLSDFKSKAVALVVEIQPNGGSVDVLQNKTLLATVSTAGSTVADRQVVLVGSWSTLHDGTITIRVATSGKPVVIDGLGLYRG